MGKRLQMSLDGEHFELRDSLEMALCATWQSICSMEGTPIKLDYKMVLKRKTTTYTSYNRLERKKIRHFT